MGIDINELFNSLSEITKNVATIFIVIGSFKHIKKKKKAPVR